MLLISAFMFDRSDDKSRVVLTGMSNDYINASHLKVISVMLNLSYNIFFHRMFNTQLIQYFKNLLHSHIDWCSMEIKWCHLYLSAAV